MEKTLAIEPKYSDWEIDRRLLKIGEKIGSGSCGDLWVALACPYVTFYPSFLLLTSFIFAMGRCRGVYLGQDVAVKLLKAEHLNESLEVEFTQEVTILRCVAWWDSYCSLVVWVCCLLSIFVILQYVMFNKLLNFKGIVSRENFIYVAIAHFCDGKVYLQELQMCRCQINNYPNKT